MIRQTGARLTGGDCMADLGISQSDKNALISFADVQIVMLNKTAKGLDDGLLIF